VVDNSVDEALAGYCTHVEVELNADGSVTVTDDGRGIPTDTHPQTGKSALETVMTVLHAGGKFGGGGTRFLVVCTVVFLSSTSEMVEVTVWQDKRVYTQRFERGIPVTELKLKPHKNPAPELQSPSSLTYKSSPLAQSLII